ncbi:MAG: hypothetical protein KGN02_12705 [bacterium]|nr:hypothetical protein [bacterium]
MAGDLETLRALVLDDRALCDDLFASTDATETIGRIVALARERGLVVNSDELWSAYHDGRSAWLATWSP